MAAGDFRGNGRTDLAVANLADNTVSVLLGNGDGTFTATATSPATRSPISIAVADFNGDGNADLAVANYSNNAQATVLLGAGDGTFTAAPIQAATFLGPSCISIGDFNGDGVADFAISNGSGPVTVYLTQRIQTATATLPNVSIARHRYPQRRGVVSGQREF